MFHLSNEEARKMVESWGIEPALDTGRYEVRLRGDTAVGVDLWTGAEYIPTIDPVNGDLILVNRVSGAVFDRMRI
jgi:hypothetical protein